jgi:tRNA(adenine34) deaminase
MRLFKNKYMELAIAEAKKSTQEEIPIGAVIIDKNSCEVLSSTHNQSIMLCDSTAHAEILAIRETCKKINNYRLDNCILYTTVEPCIMCYGAILQARIPIVYFGAYNSKYGAVENNFSINAPQIYGGIYEDECKQLLQDFFIRKRNKKTC